MLFNSNIFIPLCEDYNVFTQQCTHNILNITDKND